MNGQNSILSSFLQRSDPSLLIPRLISIINDYNRDSWRIFNAIHRWWIVKVRYPLFRYLVRKVQQSTADMLFNHPDLLVFVVTRYLVYLVRYCDIFKIDPNTCLDSIFPPGSLHMSMDTQGLADGSTKINHYNVVVRTLIPNPQDLKDRSLDKYSITRLEVDVDARAYKVSQICYDTNDPAKASTASVLYDKGFELARDGTLYNPNYAISKDLLEEDLEYYRLMVAQIMVFLGGMFEASSVVYFVEVK